jgi:hypothetical protein
MKMWKEVVVAKFEVLCRHFPRATKKTHEELRSGGLLSEIFSPRDLREYRRGE